MNECKIAKFEEFLKNEPSIGADVAEKILQRARDIFLNPEMSHSIKIHQDFIGKNDSPEAILGDLIKRNIQLSIFIHPKAQNPERPYYIAHRAGRIVTRWDVVLYDISEIEARSIMTRYPIIADLTGAIATKIKIAS